MEDDRRSSRRRRGSSDRRLQEFFRHLGQASRSPAVIDETRARNILEVCQGDMQLAGQLYWDDYLASQAADREDEEPEAEAAPPAEADPFQAAAAVAVPPVYGGSRRRGSREGGVRRRLDEDFEEQLLRRNDDPPAAAAAAAAARSDDDDEEMDILMEEDRPVPHRRAEAVPHELRHQPRRRRRHRPAVQPAAELQNVLVAAQAVAAIAAQRNQLLDPAAMAESVSVSDDEKAGVLRGLRLNAATLQQRDHNQNEEDDDDEEDDALVSNNNNDDDRAADNNDNIHGNVAGSNNSNSNTNNNNPEDAERLERRRRVAAAAVRRSKQDDASDDDNDKKPSHRRPPSPKKEEINSHNDDEDAYLSDQDWIWSNAASPNSTQLRPPLALLWGGVLPHQEEVPVAEQQATEEQEKSLSGLKRKREKASRNKRKNKRARIAIAAAAGGNGGDGDDDGDDDDGNNDAPNNNDATENSGEDNEDEREPTTQNARGRMPFTWIHASFGLDSDGQGLAVKAPTPEALMDQTNMWKRSEGDASTNGNNNNNGVPMPFHCRSVTAVLSIVTALLHTGANLQAGHISCNSARTPFVELTPEQRKREFEGRLADALSVLIFIAAKASVERKERVLAKLRKKPDGRSKQSHQKTPKKKVRLVYGTLMSDTDTTHVVADDKDEHEQKMLARKLKLWPTTWWDESPLEQLQRDEDDDAAAATNNNIPLPQIQLGSSFSHLGDIRSHVLSKMRSFTSPGGLALLLETIVGIHGESAVAHMMQKSRERKQRQRCAAAAAVQKDDDMKDSEGHAKPFLACCCCKERQQKNLESMSAAARRKMASSLDPTPPGHGCISIELLSLLLAGRVHSTLRGWSTGKLGFGMLSDKAGEVGHELARPDKPVWILRGATQYSVLYLSETNNTEASRQQGPWGKTSVNAMSKADLMATCSTGRCRDQEEATAFSKNDQPGFIATLAHWNCWYGQRNKSGLRLIAERPQWTPPSPSKVVASYREAATSSDSQGSHPWNRKSVTQRLMERRKQQQRDLVNVVSADEREISELEEKLKSNQADEEAMDRVKIHAEDKSFYPKQYRMWRYDMGDDQNRRSSISSSASSKTERWTPYFSLTRQQQLIVEMKLGPQINRILWTRWPRATIDKFTPEGRNEPPPVV